MRISKILDGRATVRLPFEYSRTQSGSGYFPLILRTSNRLDSMLFDCTRNWISRSRAIAQVWFLNNLLLFDRTLLTLKWPNHLQFVCESTHVGLSVNGRTAVPIDFCCLSLQNGIPFLQKYIVRTYERSIVMKRVKKLLFNAYRNLRINKKNLFSRTISLAALVFALIRNCIVLNDIFYRTSRFV